MGSAGRIQGEQELFQRLAEMAEKGEQGCLATVIQTRLSTPRHEGSKMIVHPDGSITGTIGGGKAEAVVMAEARKVLEDGQCRRLELDLAKGLGVCGGNMEVFLEPVLRETPFVVIGAGHVGRAMVTLGQPLSLRFLLVDDRPEFLESMETLIGVQTYTSKPATLGDFITPDPRAAVLLASRNHELDGEYLTALLKVEHETGLQFGFLGVLGSSTKSARLRQRIQKDFPEFTDRLGTIQMPVGLEIGAETPQEIALSVLAEAVAVLRGVPYLQDDEGQSLGVRLQRRRGSK